MRQKSTYTACYLCDRSTKLTLSDLDRFRFVNDLVLPFCAGIPTSISLPGELYAWLESDFFVLGLRNLPVGVKFEHLVSVIVSGCAVRHSSL